jgi:transcriptional regulator with XRE-family HTH domain
LVDNVCVIISDVRAGSIVREARRGAGLTQRELAERAGVLQPALARIERDRASPRFDTLDRLLRACGRGLEAVPRPGARVDRTLIRERLRLSPGQRARLTAREWKRTREFDRSGRARP